MPRPMASRCALSTHWEIGGGGALLACRLGIGLRLLSLGLLGLGLRSRLCRRRRLAGRLCSGGLRSCGIRLGVGVTYGLGRRLAVRLGGALAVTLGVIGRIGFLAGDTGVLAFGALGRLQLLGVGLDRG